jgi:hypothetical protein
MANTQMTASVSTNLSSIEVNGVTYVPASSTSTPPNGNREVVVIDRGWIVAGNVSKDEVANELIVSDAVHVFRWESVGFAGVLKDPKSSKVTLMNIPYPVKVPAGSVIFTIPVPQDWGK